MSPLSLPASVGRLKKLAVGNLLKYWDKLRS